MRLTIVYDNEAAEGLTADWGFSCHIETGRENVLFDTGADGDILLDNMEALGISPLEISKVVLSHEHWDHAGGLSSLLEEADDLQVYAPASFPSRLKNGISSQAELIPVSGAMDICEKVTSTGELGRTVKEQSLVLRTDSGGFVITGCCHPGLGETLRAASGQGKVMGILGGLHGSTEYHLMEGMELIAPCHCTMHKEEIAKRFPHAFRRVMAGSVIEL